MQSIFKIVVVTLNLLSKKLKVMKDQLVIIKI